MGPGLGQETPKSSAGAARTRPQLDEMMADIRQRKADVVLVWAFDRFARSTSHLVSTLEELQSLGVDFISYKQQIDTSTAAGKLTFTVLAAIAEFEREMIRERVKTGMVNAKKAGTKSGNPIGRPKISAAKLAAAERADRPISAAANDDAITAPEGEPGML